MRTSTEIYKKQCAAGNFFRMQAGFSHYFAKTPAGGGVGADRREAAETEHHPARAARICLRELEADSAAPLASSPTGGADLSAMPGLYRAPACPCAANSAERQKKDAARHPFFHIYSSQKYLLSPLFSAVSSLCSLLFTLTIPRSSSSSSSEISSSAEG